MKYSKKEMVRELATYNNIYNVTNYDIEGIVYKLKRVPQLMKMWRKASCVGSFLNAVKESEFKYSNVMIQLMHKDWYFRRGWCGDKGKVFKTYSDVGSLKLGNKHFSQLLPNAYGDSENRVAILPAECLDDCFRFFPNHYGIIKGENINVYYHDCSDEVEYELGTGEFWLFGDERFFAIVKMEEDDE